MDRCPGDDTFGPVLEHHDGNCYNFDFTLVFEESIFSIAPCIIVLPLAAVRWWHLWSKPRRTWNSWLVLLTTKLGVYGLEAIIQLALVSLWAAGHGVTTKTTLAAAALAFVSMLGLTILSIFEHSRDLRPSIILQSFLAATTLLDLPRTRTQWLLQDNTAVASLFTTTLLLRVVILVVESLQKWTDEKEWPDGASREMTHGIFGHTFLWWLRPLLLTGYKRDIRMEDLDEVDVDLRGETLGNRLLKAWETVDKSRKHCLSIACLRTFLPELTLAFLPRMAYTGFTLSQPFLVRSTLTYISSRPAMPRDYGYGLIGAFALCYIGIAVTTRFYMYLAFRTMAKVRGALVGSIYKAMLSIRAETGNSSAALSLMSTDVDRLTITAYMLINIGPDIIQVALALWILSTQLGTSSISAIILCVISAAGAIYIAKLVPIRQTKWMAAIQKRVGITSDVLGSMKGIKVAGLTKHAEQQIQGLRNFEMAESKQFRKVQVFSVLSGIAPTLLLPVVVFTVYAIAQKLSGGDQIDVASAFTSLSLLNILITPVMDLITSIPNLTAAMACLDRIQAFLLKEKLEEYRTLRPAPFSAPLTPSGDENGDKDSEKVEEPWIKLRGACLGWGKDASPVIKDADLDVYPSQLVLVIGPVASGKSTLLRGIIGEAYLLGGSVEYTVPAEVAYCDQDAWLLNQSIRDNIVAFSPYNEGFYDRVVEACQLNEDLKQLPNGDKTIIGSRGLSLSGGQKQRVALARAVYNRRPIVILDDILKGLDADTYSKCFTAVLGPEGLFRTGSRTTIVMATHNVQLLPHADHIVVLGEDGRIIEQGKFRDLKGDVSRLGLKELSQEVNLQEIEEELSNKKELLAKIASSKEAKNTEKATDTEDRARGRRNADALISYMRSMGTAKLITFGLLTLGSTGFRFAGPLWLNVWASASQEDASSRVGYYVGIFVMFGILSVVSLALQFWIFVVSIVPYSAKLLHRRVLVAAMQAPLSFFVSTDTGEIVNRFSQDMTLVDMQLPTGFMMTYSTLVATVAQVALTCVASGWLALSIPGLILLLFFLQKFYLRTSRQMRLLDLEAKAPIFAFFISSFEGLTAIRAYGWTKAADEANLKRLDESQKPYYLFWMMQRWLGLVLDLAVGGLAVLLVGLAVALKDQINPGLLGVALTSVMSIGVSMSMLIQMWTLLETSLGAITRINHFEADTPREVDGPGMPAPGWPPQGGIQITGLSAKYGDQTVLSDLTFSIGPGEKVAICGRSGSGKSTLMMLLLRIYQPEAGTITIDDTDTSTLNLNALRESVLALPQDPMFLAGTVRYNLDPVGRCTDEQIRTALEKTGIRDVIDEKGGLDADLNTDWLSAGQRQLFCLARAMLRKSHVLLLDEATSSLDRTTETFVSELVRTEFKDWTVITVAHRLETIVDFDKVLVLQDGHIVEFDSPKVLLANSGSIFKSLWDLQHR
ncbi:ABC transporter [Cercophora newfieldiana]|uniref:ABC transporter n=1 Tax=Cercophora newfieldiana TaxID=92897 RepID=A0AA40CP35_9PEZI|nr:ABC transporter [Cercophora newfieldiana]